MSQLSAILRKNFPILAKLSAANRRRRLRNVEAELHQCRQELRIQRDELSALRDEIKVAQRAFVEIREELFDVPALPSLKFLAHPLDERLDEARRQMAAFLDTSSVSNAEHDYLLMQMVFRGSMQNIREQLLAVIESIRVPEHVKDLAVVDIGCGRGELLEVLKERKFHAIGIDTSQLMIRKLTDQNHEVVYGDGIEQLERFADNHLGGVTAFHVIEHVQPEYLKELLEVAYRKIAPGGFVLLETPNPFCHESLSFFYTDDTHTRPIQPFQLAFLVENTGFTDSRAHFSAPVPAGRKQSMNNWLRLYQNHGLVAYKPQASVRIRTHAA